MHSEYLTLLSLMALLGFVVVNLVTPQILKWNFSRAREARQAGEDEARAVSRLGGIGLAAAFLSIAAVASIWLPTEDDYRARIRWVIIGSSTAMFLLGLWDDLKPLGARKKLMGQILIALVVCACGVRIRLFQNPFTNEIYALGYWSWLVTVFWLVALTNMVNLIDGIDGLAGGVALMLMGLLAYFGLGGGLVFPILAAAGMTGALLGFLRFNFPPAKIYMGDGGAYFLGFLIGMLTLVHSQKGTILAALIAPLFALALPIMDVALAILRRGVKGLPIFRPDRRHIHHRLLASGFSHRRTVLTLYGVSLICLLMALGLFWTQGRLLPILCGFMFLLFLVSIRSLGLGQDWFTVGGALGNVLRLRRETRYALCLSRWLELEAERSESAEDLWEGYVFLLKKFGFVRVRLTSGDGERNWSRGGENPAELQVRELAVATGNIDGIEFTADVGTMSPKLFELMTELAAEAWTRAALRWEETRYQPVNLKFEPPG